MSIALLPQSLKKLKALSAKYGSYVKQLTVVSKTYDADMHALTLEKFKKCHQDWQKVLGIELPLTEQRAAEYLEKQKTVIREQDIMMLTYDVDLKASLVQLPSLEILVITTLLPSKTWRSLLGDHLIAPDQTRYQIELEEQIPKPVSFQRVESILPGLNHNVPLKRFVCEDQVVELLDSPPKALERVIPGLYEFSIEFVGLSWGSLRQGRLGQHLEPARKLRSLDVNLHINPRQRQYCDLQQLLGNQSWPSLERLVLRGVKVDRAGLEPLLKRHERTLRELWLDDPRFCTIPVVLLLQETRFLDCVWLTAQHQPEAKFFKIASEFIKGLADFLLPYLGYEKSYTNSRFLPRCRHYHEF